MHRCWLISELVTRIAEECADSRVQGAPLGTSTENREALYALARTCRALQEPALDLLWYRASTLVHLIRCLPQDLWTMQEAASSRTRRPSNELQLTHVRPMVSEDWTRFDFYARRIRVFAAADVLSDGPPHRAREVMDELHAYKDAPLLPNLRSVETRGRKPYIALGGDQKPANLEAINFILCVAPPSLEAINLCLCEECAGSKASEGLQTLTTSFPRVQRVTFRPHSPAPGVDFAILVEPIAKWLNLRSVTLCPMPRGRHSDVLSALNHQLLTQLSKLPNLTEFRLMLLIRFQDGSEGSGGPGHGRPLQFQHLRKFRIHSLTATVIQGLLEWMLFPRLNELDLTAGDAPLLDHIPKHLSTSVFSGTLKRLDISAQPSWRHPATDILASSILPLKHLRGLQHLSLKVSRDGPPFVISMSDDDWAVLAPAWPHIQSLAIEDGVHLKPGPPTIPRPTYRSLLHLAYHCPELSSVTMTAVQSQLSVNGEHDEVIDITKSPRRLASLRLRIMTVLLDQSQWPLSRAGSEEDFEEFTWEEAMDLLVLQDPITSDV